MTKYWKKDGKYVRGASGGLVKCDDCPCDSGPSCTDCVEAATAISTDFAIFGLYHRAVSGKLVGAWSAGWDGWVFQSAGGSWCRVVSTTLAAVCLTADSPHDSDPLVFTRKSLFTTLTIRIYASQSDANADTGHLSEITEDLDEIQWETGGTTVDVYADTVVGSDMSPTRFFSGSIAFPGTDFMSDGETHAFSNTVVGGPSITLTMVACGGDTTDPANHPDYTQAYPNGVRIKSYVDGTTLSRCGAASYTGTAWDGSFTALNTGDMEVDFGTYDEIDGTYLDGALLETNAEHAIEIVDPDGTVWTGEKTTGIFPTGIYARTGGCNATPTALEIEAIP